MHLLQMLLQASQRSDLHAIKDTLERILQQEDSNFWNGDLYIVGVASMVISAFGVYTIIHEFRSDRIDEMCQINLLKDLIRHIYRNKVCTIAMRAKYNMLSKKGVRCYPSEEHLLKLQLLPEDIHLERYNHDGDIYNELHKLELRLRNYNTEIEIAQQHITSKEIDTLTKQRDFDTLDFKTGYLTSLIADVLYLILQKAGIMGRARYHLKKFFLRKERVKKEEVTKIIFTEIQNSHEENVEEFIEKQCLRGDEYADELSLLRQDEEQNDKYFTEVYSKDKPKADGFSRMLTEDLLIECGKNEKGEEKIHIIVPLSK